uniref:protein-serine/threonine phosphatase n=1 Tax=Anopheles christyi TaxID=43041 RepID=A0A182K096_9DIPT
DKKSAHDEETQSKIIDGRSECQKFSTSQGSIALMLGSNEHLRAASEDQLPATGITAACTFVDVSDASGSTVDSVVSNNDAANTNAAGAVEAGESKVEGKTPSRPASSCSSGSSSSSSDIQQHLQSMFCLLRPEETLKMAVKLESLRTGRTRYLVVVSRTVTSKRHNTGTPYLTGSGSNSSIGNNTSSTWQMSAPPTVTTSVATVASQPLGRITATSTGTSGQHMRHGSCSSETFSGSDTYVSSLDNCVLSVGSTSGGRLPSGNATCRSDQCDSKANSRLISSTVSADVLTSGTSSDYVCAPVSSPSADDTALSDKRNCSNESACAFDQGDPQAQHQQHPNSSNSAIPVEGGKKIEESCLLGIDCNERTTVGLVLKVLADTSIWLDGDGGFSVSSCGKQHIFKPVSVQAMWSALQTLHKASFKAREHNFFAGGPSHDWVTYYEAHIDSDRSCLNEWNAMDSLESRRPPSPGSIRNKPTEREETESVIRSKLKEVMMSVDLDDVTSKFIRGRLEELLDMDLGEYKPFIDAEMLVILGQMDAPTEIFDHVYLGSEWNASNLEELQRNGVHHILNVTREIDNFFPGLFHYCNVRVYDDEKTDLLRHWDNTFKFISRAKMEGSKVLVHCKMGISRSASVVIAYAMKANGWDFEHALRHVKEKRSCIKPNKNFLMQLETYQGMLDAMKNKEKLQRSKSETNLKLTGAKEGRSLPGSEPTPLIQALNGAGGKKHTSPTAHLSPVGKETDLSGGIGMEKIESDTSDEGTDEGDAGPSRGRTRTRQIKQQAALHQHHIHQDEAACTGNQPHPKEDNPMLANNPEAISKATKLFANLFLPPASCKPWNACDGRICTRGSGALKRHKSLSPESLNPRWPDNYDFETSSLAYAEKSFTEKSKASRTRTMLELDSAVESCAVSGPSGSGRRKQQSYSLEHLHGGALEMRSPCTETKTIRMPCGNGQNYSVSPNQIVHLQDKMPTSCVRKAVSSMKPTNNVNTTNLKQTRTGSFLRKLFPANSNYNSSSNSDSPSSNAETSHVLADSSIQSLTTTVPSTIPSASASLVSTVKTIVNELECNSSSSGNIPIAPPPLLTDPGAALTASVPIPIASVAAEAAAVAVASAIREASRKNVVQDSAERRTSPTPDPNSTDAHGGWKSANNPEQWDPGETTVPSSNESKNEPICWTSSAQIIQQCLAPEFPEPAAPIDSGSSVEICERIVDSETSSCATGKSPEQGVMRQCSWSSCDSNCTGLIDEPRVVGSYVSCFSQRCLPISQPPGAVCSGSAPPIEEKEDIPWHPGTVKRTKKRIEERGTNAAVGTLKWNTSSILSTEKSAVVQEGGSIASCPAAHPTRHVPSQKNQPPDLGQADGYHPPTRERQGMVSSSYARLSASAPDSYNLYAGPGNRAGSIGSNVTTDPMPAKRQTKLSHQHSFAGAVDSLARIGEPVPYCLRVSFRGSSSQSTNRQSQHQETEDATEEDSFNAGKVRNLKMNFEAKSSVRRQGQKKVRSLPSSPVAVHVSMGSQTKRTPAQSVSTGVSSTVCSIMPSASSSVVSSSTSSPPSAVSVSSTIKNNNQTKTPPEDVTVRDLVDRYEEHGPRMRQIGSNSLSRAQRPRSVFEPLKQTGGVGGGKPFVQTSSLLSHSTSQLRLEDSMRPPVPPIVRGLVIPQVSGSGGGSSSAHYNNNNSRTSNSTSINCNVQSGRVSSCAFGISANSNSNAKNNNNSKPILQQPGGAAAEAGIAPGTTGGRRTQQHGRTHPLAKISPNARHHHHHLHVHHHHHLVHQYTVGQLQQHRHIGATPGSGVSGTTGPSATTVTANAYNTM